MGKKKEVLAGGGDKLKKGVIVDDNEYPVISMLMSEEQQNDDQGVVAMITGNKEIGTGRNSKKVNFKEDDVVAAPFVITGKKKSKSKKGGGSVSFELLRIQSEGDHDEPVISSAGKENESLKKEKDDGSVSAFAALNDHAGDEQSEVIDNDDKLLIPFTGKKSSKSTKKVGGGLVSSAFAELAEEEENEEKVEEDNELSIVFSGKKKKMSKGSKKGNSPLLNAVEHIEDVSNLITNKEEVAITEKEEVVVEISKNKKKIKKKSEKTDKEDDEFDKLLAEFGEGTSVKTHVPPVTVQTETATPADITTQSVVPVDTTEEGESRESAAAKKKRKKREKEKEKKALAVSEATTSGTAPSEGGKKVPRHVREKQEALAKFQEAEERRKREEAEKLRKEEEERLRQEKIEQQEIEIKRKKKEKEKEKRLKKQQERKQREEAQRFEAIRNQLLANRRILSLPTTDVPNGEAPAEVEYIEPQESPEETESSTIFPESENVTELVESEAVVKGNEDDKSDMEWDAKSWDDPDVLPTIPAFDEKEDESDPVNPAMPAFDEEEDESDPVDPASHDEQSLSTATTMTERNLRSPICCIMGHVDTGKTKLLDCIRGTNVQEGEAGGITQQIGATYFPAENIRDRTKADAQINVPGLLVIDTPGHESFANLRSRGSGLCDIAILVVDIMHGLEPQTIESLNLLTKPPRNTEFIVALNKVDKLYGWKECTNKPIKHAMREQSAQVKNEFKKRLTDIITKFKEQGLNTELYYNNRAMEEVISIVPTSAISGEGIPDLLLFLVQRAQKTMIEKLTYRNELQCTVLEVKVIAGHGTTIDVVLVNGVLHEGDQIVVSGMQGAIVTNIKALLTPHPMKELRVKGTYLHHKEIKAAHAIKISARGLEHAIAGTGLYVANPEDDLEEVMAAAMADLNPVLSRVDGSGEGVCVQASTMGSLEALLDFLDTPEVNIPVSSIGLGPVHKKDVVKAGVMLEKKREYAIILAFDVKVTPEAQDLAEELGVNIFMADIIYHLSNQFKAYIDNLKEEKKRETAAEAVFPCVLKIIPKHIFNQKDPIVLGVDVLQGIVKVGTPICIPSKEFIDIGRIASIENNHRPVVSAKKGQKVAIKIVGCNAEEQQKSVGRHFGIEDELVSHITRDSCEVLEANFRDELHSDEVKLLRMLKKIFRIP